MLEETNNPDRVPDDDVREQRGMGSGEPGPKFFVDVEGTVHPWSRATITTEEIATLGGWPLSLGVIEIDKENNERTLKPGEVVELKPGGGFSKKIKFKRG
jgi:hypothetical protein